MAEKLSAPQTNSRNAKFLPPRFAKRIVKVAIHADFTGVFATLGRGMLLEISSPRNSWRRAVAKMMDANG